MSDDSKQHTEGKGTEQETRERVLAAAKQLMAEKGYKGATTRKIAELAGVNEVTIFRHFKNKEGLLDAALEEMTAIRPIMEKAVRDLNGDIEELLVSYAVHYYQLLIERKDSFIICMFEARDRPELAQMFSRIPETAGIVLMETLEKLHAQGRIKKKEFGVAAYMFLSSVFMEFIATHHVGIETCPLGENEHELFRQGANILMNGLKQES
ncbi:MAG: TetR/AcrR family transcriptional regulator [Clostridia bacterium]